MKRSDGQHKKLKYHTNKTEKTTVVWNDVMLSEENFMGK
jgi:hypothetical protein